MDTCAFDKLFSKNVPHILEKIFLSLDYESYKTCMEVSSVWNKLLVSELYRKIGKSVFHSEISKDQEKLWNAAMYGNANEVRRLILSRMLDVNSTYGVRMIKNKNNIIRCINDETPLHIAARNGHMDVVQLLIDTGADPKRADRDGWTPLKLAAEHGHEDVLEFFLDKGGDPQEVYRNWTTPLHWAASRGHKAVVQLLLDRGADANTADDEKMIPLHWAMDGKCNNDVLHLLIEHGARVNWQDMRGKTPLHYGAMKGCNDAVQILLDNGALHDKVDRNGKTPFSVAHQYVLPVLVCTCKHGSTDVAKTLTNFNKQK